MGSIMLLSILSARTVLRAGWFSKKLLFRPDKHAANHRGHQCQVQCSDQLQRGLRLSQPKYIALYFEQNLSSLRPLG
jgi:hypothetical protein